MMDRLRKAWFRLLLILAGTLTAAAVLLLAAFFRIRPLLYRYAESQAETLLLDAANQAVMNILGQEDITYNGIVLLSRNDEGDVTGLEIDIRQINLLKSEIGAEMTRIVGENETYEISVPLGMLLGYEYLNRLGPRLKFSMQVASTTVADFEHHFYSAGINQVLHQILIRMDISGSVLMIGSSEHFSTKTTVIAAQTVIVGATPDTFTNVEERPNDDIADEIFNYATLE